MVWISGVILSGRRQDQTNMYTLQGFEDALKVQTFQEASFGQVRWTLLRSR